MPPRRTIALALLASTLLAAPAAAQDCDAECHVQRGLEARTRNDDAAAVGHFEAALRLERSPRALAQLALAEQALGRWSAAQTHLSEALAADDAWIRSHREVLDGAMRTIRSHLGRLTVSANVEGAAVRINGREVGALPLTDPLWVEVGTAVVELSAAGYVPVRRQAEITAGGLSRVHVDLVAEAPTAAETTTGEPADPGASPMADPSNPVRRTEETSPFAILAGVGLGLTAAALAGTIVAGVVREENVMRWNDPSQCPPGGPDGRATECPDVPGAWETAEHWTIAMGVLTGALLALSITFVVLAVVDADGEEQAAIDVEVGAGSATLRARARF